MNTLHYAPSHSYPTIRISSGTGCQLLQIRVLFPSILPVHMGSIKVLCSIWKLGVGFWADLASQEYDHTYYSSRSHESMDVLSGHPTFTSVPAERTGDFYNRREDSKVHYLFHSFCSHQLMKFPLRFCVLIFQSFSHFPNLRSSSLLIKSVFQLMRLCLLTSKIPEARSTINANPTDSLPRVAMDTCSVCHWHTSIFSSLVPYI